MKDLKNTITKTDTLKNDLKLAKQKINDKILSGGGTIADTISDIPSAIDKMLKDNYKKVAMIDNLTCVMEQYKNSEKAEITHKITISNINLNFVPSFFIVGFEASSTIWEKYSIDTRNSTMSFDFSEYNGFRFYGEYTEFKDSILTLYIRNNYDYNQPKFRKFDIIAIE